MTNTPNTTLTLSDMIDTLYTLSSGSYGSRGQHFTDLFHSYHEHRSAELQYDYATPDSVVSRLVHRHAPRLPKPMHLHYIRSHPDHLHQDLSRYISTTIITAKQHREHYTRICAMIDCAANIDPMDKEYVYAGNEIDSGTDLIDILYRAMVVLLHEP